MFKKHFRGIGLLLVLMLVLSSLVGCIALKNDQAAIEGEFQKIDVSSIDMEGTLEIIEELSSTKYMGRLAGTPENEKAVEYIANYFKEIGLESPVGVVDYRQSYHQKVIINESAPMIRIEDTKGNISKEFNFIKDFRIINSWKGLKIKGSTTAEMVVIKETSELNTNKNLEGKILLIENSALGSPTEVNYLLRLMLDFIDLRIAGIIFNIDKNNAVDNYIVSTVLWNVVDDRVNAFDNEEGPIMAYVTDEVFEELKKAQLEEQRLHMAVDYRYEDAEVSNVVGVIPGQDQTLKDEYIILTGHMDHVGDNKNGTYQPGALDNASGTAAMMEIARVLKESKVAPKKTIVFIAFNGEEEGLFGSEHYVSNPICSLDKSVVINMDMVGSKENVRLTIGGEASDLKNDLFRLALQSGINAKTVNDIASDQRPFNRQGVEAVTLINLDDSRIHTIEDDMSNVDGDRMEEVIRLVLRYVEGEGY